MVAIWVMLVMMVSVPMGAVMSPVAVSTVSVVIVSVSASVSLIAITIVVVVAFMVATLKRNYRHSDLDSDAYLGLGFRRRRQADGNNQTEYSQYHFLQHTLNLHHYFVLANHRRYSYSLRNRC